MLYICIGESQSALLELSSRGTVLMFLLRSRGNMSDNSTGIEFEDEDFYGDLVR